MASGLTWREAQAGRGSRRLGAVRSSGLPSWTPGLALEDANLIAEKKYLRLQAGLGVAADEEDIEEQAEEAVDKGQEHDAPSSQARPLAQIGLPIGVFAPHRRCWSASPGWWGVPPSSDARSLENSGRF